MSSLLETSAFGLLPRYQAQGEESADGEAKATVLFAKVSRSNSTLTLNSDRLSGIWGSSSGG